MKSSEPDSYVVGLIGAEIGPSLSPALHEREADQLGLRYVYRRIDIAALGRPPEDVGELVAAAQQLGFSGLNITHPCKQLVVEHLDELSADAEALGAVNTVVFDAGLAVGHNTDWPGFQASFARGLPDVDTDRVRAGGRRRSRRRGRPRDAVARRATARRGRRRPGAGGRAGRLAARALRPRPGRRVAAQPPGLRSSPRRTASSTPRPAGMEAHDGAAISPEHLHARLWVADVVYRPLETELLRDARAARVPDARRRRHGRLPGRALVRPVHRARARPRAHAAPLRGAERRRAGADRARS